MIQNILPIASSNQALNSLRKTTKMSRIKKMFLYYIWFFSHHMTSSTCVHLPKYKKSSGSNQIVQVLRPRWHLDKVSRFLVYSDQISLSISKFSCSKSVTKWPVRFSRCILTSPQGKAGPLPTGLDIFFSRPTFNFRSPYLLPELFLDEILFCCIIEQKGSLSFSL